MANSIARTESGRDLAPTAKPENYSLCSIEKAADFLRHDYGVAPMNDPWLLEVPVAA